MAKRRPTHDESTFGTWKDAVSLEGAAPGLSARSLRDLTGLLALPALWVGKDGNTIVELMAQAIERVVPLVAVYGFASVLPGEAPLRVLRLRHRPVAADLHDSAGFRAACESMPRDHDKISIADAWTGPVQIVRMQIGYSGLGGAFWFASADELDETGTAFIRSALSLAAAGLHTARIHHEKEQASQAKDEFLAMLGHELRNPLAPISTALHLYKLRNAGPLPSEFAVIDRQVVHLTKLVDDLLDVARITRGQIELDVHPEDLRTILLQAVESVSPLLESRQHRLSLSIDDCGLVNGDKTRLRQVFSNLLTNAAKYTDTGGSISVRAQLSGDRAVIEIEDNGTGISPQLLPKIFNLFEQGSVTFARSQGGLGIGLALVKKFVEQHGGEVKAASPGIGFGSCFTVTLPSLSKRAMTVENASASPLVLQTTRRRVLIVDDNTDALEVMEVLLRQYGYDVAVADGPAAAIELAESFEPEVAILDLGLPVMDGYELATELKHRSGERPLFLIAVTGYGQETDRAKSSSAGFQHHFVKPVNVDALIASLELLGAPQ